MENYQRRLHKIFLLRASIKNNSIEINNPESKLFDLHMEKLNPYKQKRLKSQGYKIIMWDVLSADFDQTITKKDV
jgi:hypothetical protein